MKKKIALLIAGVASGLGYYFYKKNKKKEKVIVDYDERSLAKDNNDYVVYSDDEVKDADPGEEMFV